MHNNTVDRTTNGTRSVSSMTLAEIQALTINYENNINLYTDLKLPTLDEFLNTLKKYEVVSVIEIKTMSIDSISNLISIIKKWGFENKSIIISFNFSILQ